MISCNVFFFFQKSISSFKPPLQLCRKFFLAYESRRSGVNFYARKMAILDPCAVPAVELGLQQSWQWNLIFSAIMNSFGLSLEFFHVFSSLLGRPRWSPSRLHPASPVAGAVLRAGPTPPASRWPLFEWRIWLGRVTDCFILQLVVLLVAEKWLLKSLIISFRESQNGHIVILQANLQI